MFEEGRAHQALHGAVIQQPLHCRLGFLDAFDSDSTVSQKSEHSL
jgi:hypothetical protein